MTPTPSKPIRVVVVDDSAFMRKILSRMLGEDPEIEVVATASDGLEGVERVKELKPDLVTMDIEMPRMSGLAALRRIMRDHPVPVMMISSLTTEGATATLSALEIGAVDFIPKQTSEGGMEIVRMRDELVAKIKNIARRRHTLMALARANRLAKSQKTRTEPKTAPVTAVPPAVRRRAVKRAKNHPLSCVVIGSSTGGPPALQAIIPRLPRNMPVPILVAQHMPAMFTKSLADRLDEMSALSVKEAEGGEEVKPGTVLIAPGGRHMTLRKLGSKALVQVSDSPEDTIYKPCVDVTANSVVKVFGRTAMGVILTGMGSNGAESFQSLHTEGGIVLAQSPDTCVVYGMPRAVVDAGIADDVVDIDNMADEIMSYF